MTTNTQIASFEAWAQERNACVRLDRFVTNPPDYKVPSVQRDWEVWQASRKQALAEAAALCEHLENNRDDGHGGFGVTGEDCYFAIRRLSTPEGGV